MSNYQHIPPEIQEVLEKLLEEVETCLGNNFTGMYLHGSLAMGDFNPHSSDIDYLVASERPISDSEFLGLQEMHARIWEMPSRWARELEGSYIPRNSLQRYDPQDATFPMIDLSGRFRCEHHDADWPIKLYTVREYGVPLAGPEPKLLVDPVSPEELRQAVRGVLHEWWQPMLRDTHILKQRGYQAYAVLTMCRMLYTLETGEIATKPAAARWAKTHIDSSWHNLIDDALVSGPEMDLKQLPETLKLITLVMEKIS